MVKLFAKRTPLSQVNWSSWRPEKGFFSDHVIFWSMCLCVLFIIIMILVSFFKLRSGVESVTLHYNVLIGVDLVGPGWQVYQLPLLAFILGICNFVLAKKFMSFESFAAHLLVIAAVLVSIALLIANIVILNFA